MNRKQKAVMRDSNLKMLGRFSSGHHARAFSTKDIEEIKAVREKIVKEQQTVKK